MPSATRWRTQPRWGCWPSSRAGTGRRSARSGDGALGDHGNISPMPQKPIPPEDRYEAKVDRSGGPDACHPWRASHHRTGYGKFGVAKGSIVFAHRWAFLTFINPTLKPDEQVRHTCDNRSCQNPKHQGNGYHRDNMQDMVDRGRSVKKEICKNGHDISKNAYW